MSAIITIRKVVGAGYAPGDYAQLHGNGGSGDIDWNTPVNNKIYELFPNGAVVIKAQVQVDVCGAYKFGFAVYDKLGNAHQGTPDEVTVDVHIAPPAPTGLEFNSYNKTTNVLILDAA